MQSELAQSDKTNEILHQSDDVLNSQRRKIIKKYPTLKKNLLSIGLIATTFFAAACGSVDSADGDIVQQVNTLPTMTSSSGLDAEYSTMITEETSIEPESEKRIVDIPSDEQSVIFGAAEAVHDYYLPTGNSILTERIAYSIPSTADSLLIKNYTEEKIDPLAVATIYENVVVAAENQDFISGMQYEYRGNVYGVSVSKDPRVGGKIIYFYKDKNTVWYGKSFIGNYINVGHINLVKDDLDLSNISIATEACQQTYWFDFYTKAEISNTDASQVELKNIAQEYGCNTIGSAVGLRAAGYSYDDYVKYVTEIRANFSPQHHPEGMTVGLMSETLYNSLTSSTSAFK